MGLIIIPGQEPGPEPEPAGDFVRIPPEDVARWVAAAIGQNRRVRRETRSQEAVDRCVEILFEEGEVYTAAGLLHLAALRVMAQEALGLSLLFQALLELRSAGAFAQRCRVCGCTNDVACEGGCEWVAFDLCSACDRKLKAATVRAMGPGPGRDG